MSKIDYLIQTIGIVQKFIWISTDPYSSANFGTKFNSTPSHHILLASSFGLLKPIPACQKYFKIFYFANYAMALKAQRQVVGPAWLPAYLPTHLCMIPSKWIRSVKFCKFWPFFRRDFDACKTPRRPPPSLLSWYSPAGCNNIVSRTVWPDCWITLQHLAMYINKKVAQKNTKFTKVGSKFCPIVKKPWRIAQDFDFFAKVAKFCQIWSHEIDFDQK